MKLDDAIEIVKHCDCPSCGAKLDACSGVDANGQAPKEGDITVCLYCGNLMTFTETLRLRALTEAELAEISSDPRIMAIQAARRDMKS